MSLDASIIKGLKLNREWGYVDPRDDDPQEPVGWYSEAEEHDARLKAIEDAARVNGQVFSRYTTPWVKV